VLLSNDASPVTGIGLALRVVGLALPGVLLISSTDPVRVADALTIHWRVSTRFAYGALAALRLAPLLVTEFEAIRLARRTRGVEAGRNPLAAARLLAGAGFTLLVGAVRRGSRLATAMDARGFDSGVPRTNARGSRLHRRDAFFVAGTVAVCAAAVALSIGTGGWNPVFVGD
jgi:energy-coupling factor transport system permease protein